MVRGRRGDGGRCAEAAGVAQLRGGVHGWRGAALVDEKATRRWRSASASSVGSAST